MRPAELDRRCTRRCRSRRVRRRGPSREPRHGAGAVASQEVPHGAELADSARQGRCVPPAPGRMPSRTSGSAKGRDSYGGENDVAMHGETSAPPPSAMPSTAAIIVLAAGRDRRPDTLKLRRHDLRCVSVYKLPDVPAPQRRPGYARDEADGAHLRGIACRGNGLQQALRSGRLSTLRTLGPVQPQQERRLMPLLDRDLCHHADRAPGEVRRALLDEAANALGRVLAGPQAASDHVEPGHGGGAFLDRGAGVATRGIHRQRRRAEGDLLADLARPRLHLHHRHDLLHEAEAERRRGVELVAGEQVAHGVAPSGALDQADRTPRRQMPRLTSSCANGSMRGDHDVGRQRKLDADREADALAATTIGLQMR